MSSLTPKPKTKIIASAIGRRKESIAAVRLVSGTGLITINAQPVSDYFPALSAKMRYEQPFKVVSANKYDALIKVNGGGKVGQLEAVVLAISRALSDTNKDHVFLLRQAGLLTRDSRERQRRMVGTGGKSRRRKQSPKR